MSPDFWGVLLLVVFYRYNGSYAVPLYGSLLYVVYYGGVSAYLTAKTRS